MSVGFSKNSGSDSTGQECGHGLERLEAAPLPIEPGSPWENGHDEIFDGNSRDELRTKGIVPHIPEMPKQ